MPAIIPSSIKTFLNSVTESFPFLFQSFLSRLVVSWKSLPDTHCLNIIRSFGYILSAEDYAKN